MKKKENKSRPILLTFKLAAEELGLPYGKIQRAARAGLIPTYSLVNKRKYVRLEDITSRMASSDDESMN